MTPTEIKCRQYIEITYFCVTIVVLLTGGGVGVCVGAGVDFEFLTIILTILLPTWMRCVCPTCTNVDDVDDDDDGGGGGRCSPDISSVSGFVPNGSLHQCM